MIFQLFIPGNPVPKGRPRLGKHGNVYTPAKTKSYEEYIGWKYKEADGILFDGEIGIRLIFVRETKHRVDLDNLIKSILDGLNRVAWDDDSQIIFLEAALTFNKHRPGVNIEIWQKERDE